MRGIIMAGGAGTRLRPITSIINKHLLPVYDKPMIYYPLGTLMLSGIREICIIAGEEALASYQKLLGEGSDWGLQLSYLAQEEPRGIAEGILLAEHFIQNAPVALILGDNIFYGQEMGKILAKRVDAHQEGAMLFAYWVRDPERYGVVEFDADEKPFRLREKPNPAPSHWAVTGLYLYDGTVCEKAKQLQPSERGELEITDLNQIYLNAGLAKVIRLGRGQAWLDTGTPGSLIEAAQFFKTIEDRQGLKINVPEEIAWRMGYIDDKQLKRLTAQLGASDYRDYLMSLSTVLG